MLELVKEIEGVRAQLIQDNRTCGLLFLREPQDGDYGHSLGSLCQSLTTVAVKGVRSYV